LLYEQLRVGGDDIVPTELGVTLNLELFIEKVKSVSIQIRNYLHDKFKQIYYTWAPF